MNLVFENLQINGYRGLKSVNLSDLGQINIFVGNNNSGKTSLIEAISILCNPLNPFRWLDVSQRRAYIGQLRPFYTPDLEAIKWIFPQNIDLSTDILYKGSLSIKSDGNSYIKSIDANLTEILGFNHQDHLSEDIENELYDDTNFSVTGLELELIVNLYSGQNNLFDKGFDVQKELFVFWANERFTSKNRPKSIIDSATISPAYTSSESILSRLSKIILKEEKDKQEVLNLLKSFDKNIVDFQILSPNDKTNRDIEHKELGFAPLYAFGDGFKRAFVIALSLFSISGGVLLIDEIETSIHVSALCPLFSWLIESCRTRNIQLFVTTHSLEAIDAMLQAEIATDDIVAFRLNTEGQNPQRFSGDLLHRLRSERGLDVR